MKFKFVLAITLCFIVLDRYDIVTTQQLELVTISERIEEVPGQVLTTVIAPNTPFQVSWDQDTSIPASFRAWCENAIIKNWGPSEITKAAVANLDGTFAITATFPGIPAGNHSCFVSAFNDAGESKGIAIPIFVGTIPATPLRLKVIVKVGG